MPTVSELLDDIHKDLNAVSAANKAMNGIEAFVKDVLNKFEKGANDEAFTAMRVLENFVENAKRAISANVVPASAGPVGKSPHEQYLEQAADIVHQSLTHAQSMIEPLQDTLNKVTAAVGSISTALAAIKSPDLRKQ